MLSFIWSSLSNWDRADLLGLLMVVVGVAGEWAITFPWVKDKLKIPYNPTNFPALEFRKLLLEVFFTGLVAIGVGLELSAWPQHIQEIESLKNANLVLEKQLQPRTITEKQIKDFIFLTETWPKFPIRVAAPAGVTEAGSYAWQIRDMLNRAKFTIPDSDTNFFVGVDFLPGAMTLPGAHTNTLEDLQIVYIGTNNPNVFMSLIIEQTNGFKRFTPMPNDTNSLEGGFIYNLSQIGIQTQANTGPPNWVEPYQFIIYIVPKNQ